MALTGGCADTVWMGADSAPSQVAGFSAASPQWVHIGEKVTIQVRLLNKQDASVYLKLQRNNEQPRYFVNAGDSPVPPVVETVEKSWLEDGPVVYRLWAYRQAGAVDGAPDGSPSPAATTTSPAAADPSDVLLQMRRLELRAYQANIRLSVPWLGVPWDWDGAVMRIIRGDDSETTIRRAGIMEDGFTALGPDVANRYWVTFDPTAAMINHTGTTQVQFTIRDEKGSPYVRRIDVPTP